MPSWNNHEYVCRCGKCTACLGRERAKNFYKAPNHIREQFFQKKASQEEALFSQGYILVNCPSCRQDRQVLASSLRHGFSCDSCGFKAPPG